MRRITDPSQSTKRKIASGSNPKSLIFPVENKDETTFWQRVIICTQVIKKGMKSMNLIQGVPTFKITIKLKEFGKKVITSGDTQG